MKESILHYVWQYKLFSASGMKTTDGEVVEVIDTGRLNTDAGPDFFNAKLKIGDTLWAGNVEFHDRSSDWNRHKHVGNNAYDNVILHIVNEADAEVTRTNGERIPQLVLRFSENIQRNYDELFAARKWIYCEDKIDLVSDILINTWKNSLLTERLERKTTEIEHLREQSQNHWEEAFYISLARSFGFGTNSQAFETMAKSMPLGVLAKHKDNLFQLEALLLGQAGFLEKDEKDTYNSELKKEYRFLQTKYKLSPMEVSQWKLLRLRPDNFPTIRLVQFADLIHHSSGLFSKILDTTDYKKLRSLFNCCVSEYWQKHYLFGNETIASKKNLGNNSIDILLINTVVPFLFAYGKKRNDENLSERAVTLLEKLKPEKNAVVTKWQFLGLKCESAFDSQALLQLKKNYCDEKKCLKCRIGHKILTVSQ